MGQWVRALEDLTGYLLEKGGFELLRVPAIAEEDETFNVRTTYGGVETYTRKVGEALHPMMAFSSYPIERSGSAQTPASMNF